VMSGYETLEDIDRGDWLMAGPHAAGAIAGTLSAAEAVAPMVGFEAAAGTLALGASVASGIGVGLLAVAAIASSITPPEPAPEPSPIVSQELDGDSVTCHDEAMDHDPGLHGESAHEAVHEEGHSTPEQMDAGMAADAAVPPPGADADQPKGPTAAGDKVEAASSQSVDPGAGGHDHGQMCVPQSTSPDGSQMGGGSGLDLTPASNPQTTQPISTTPHDGPLWSVHDTTPEWQANVDDHEVQEDRQVQLLDIHPRHHDTEFPA
jgi:hypothetical protein